METLYFGVKIFTFQLTVLMLKNNSCFCVAKEW